MVALFILFFLSLSIEFQTSQINPHYEGEIQ